MSILSMSHVLETNVKSVVPHILEAQDDDDAKDLITVHQFIAIFVEAYDQVPSIRREVLFQVLIDALDTQWLAYCATALIETAIVRGADIESINQFSHDFRMTCVSSLTRPSKIEPS
jgi:hypothetical protein